ncbi:hypothetical protein ES704_02882 [subsurface metagenome]
MKIFLVKLNIKCLIIVISLLVFIILFNFFIYTFATTEGILEIIDYSTKKIIFSRRVAPGDIFSTLYIHSVEKTPVKEIFVINNQYRIILSETQVSSSGAGLPSQVFKEEQFLLKDGKFIIKNINKFLPFIPLKVGKNSHNTFFFKEEMIDLSTLIGDGLVYIRIVKVESMK